MWIDAIWLEGGKIVVSLALVNGDDAEVFEFVDESIDCIAPAVGAGTGREGFDTLRRSICRVASGRKVTHRVRWAAQNGTKFC